MAYLYLSMAIVAEVVATSALKSSIGFTRFWPSLTVVIGYALAFWLLSLTLKDIPIGLAYAIWAGTGIVLMAAVGWVVFGQRLDLWGAVGMAFIVAGVLIVNLLSRTSAH
jgi:multidrug transporter EmrE-like cation transporter